MRTDGRRRARKRTKTVISSLIFIVSLTVLIVELMPIIVVITSGFKRDIDIWARGPFYFKPTLQSYKEVLSNSDFLNSLKNSLVVGASSTMISIIVGAMASYGLTRYVFKFKEAIAYTFLGFRMIPQISLVIPLYVMFNYLRLRDTLTGIILAHVSFNIPYVIWLLLPFFAAVPRDYEEAARVDGATEKQIFWRVFFPLVSPGLVVASVFAFLMSWNEFLYALILTSVNARTAPVAVNGFLGQYAPRWGQLTAAGTIMLIPVFVITLSLQRYIIKGLISGGIKG
ncbi:carbohydrate ABC transporter membrane protein 2, CUT1 family [Fervidobacterium pennivorans DSM 9078]|uniref:Carbohydrate ABC transporter membrane protein 2, CUT1 family n=1 Tax=Fervidobacterium pennivorans (strain DSM 9078 / Ven5) TaxID=771875 RepID=H9UCT2_FERPD|nr:carbohydrate ABC transporter permease [Fervidobacterium pennivorans]AFG35325.1 carbohydrate ABC transporter membrane protein 2, CUT1 family [Fervidobacterium pennivorans DSM 9078]